LKPGTGSAQGLSNSGFGSSSGPSGDKALPLIAPDALVSGLLGVGSRRGGCFGLPHRVLLIQPSFDGFPLRDRNHALPAHAPSALAVFRHQIGVLIVDQDQTLLLRPAAVKRIVDLMVVVLH